MIAFNAVLLSPYAGGISTYMHNLINEFNKIIDDDLLKIYLSKDHFNEYINFSKFSKVKTPLLSNNPTYRILLEHLYWNGKLKEDGIKLFHSPISHLPYNLSLPAIVTIHDLRVFRFPKTYTKLRGIYLKHAIKNSINKAEKIITISEFTKNEIIDIFNTPSEKIISIHEGVDTSKFKTLKKKLDIVVLNNYGINKPYIFSVGHLEPRKNFLRLIQAYELLKKQYKNEFQLVIGGKENYYFKYLYDYVHKNKLEKNVIFTGYISDKDLPVLYRNANLFIFPSIYEGFGLPPLESIASGVPVVASNVSSIPEVLGNSAQFFDPYSVESIAENMQKLLDNDIMQLELIRKGKEILKKYSWRSCAEKTYSVYKDVLNII